MLESVPTLVKITCPNMRHDGLKSQTKSHIVIMWRMVDVNSDVKRHLIGTSFCTALDNGVRTLLDENLFDDVMTIGYSYILKNLYLSSLSYWFPLAKNPLVFDFRKVTNTSTITITSLCQINNICRCIGHILHSNKVWANMTKNRVNKYSENS